MKTLVTLLLVAAASLAFAPPAFAKTAKLTRAQQEKIKKMGSAFGTHHQLRGSTVFGKMPSSGAGTTTVENDKFLEDLIGSRKDFSDRERRDAERQ